MRSQYSNNFNANTILVPHGSIVILSPNLGASVLRDTILASSLPLLNSISALEPDQFNHARLSSLQSERILCPNPSLGLTSDMFIFDVKDCLKNMTGEESFAAISGLSPLLESLGGRYGKYKCSGSECKLRSIDPSELSWLILGKALSYQDKELILFLSEDFNYKTEGEQSNSDFLLWKLREEISLGVSRFLYDHSLYEVKDDPSLTVNDLGLPSDVKNRSLGLILRTIKLGNLSQEGLEDKIKEALGEGRSRNAKVLGAHLFLKIPLKKSQAVQSEHFEKDYNYNYVSSFSLDTDFTCSTCNQSFKYPDKKFVKEDRSLELISPGNSGESKSENELPGLHLGSLALYRYSGTLNYLSNYILGDYGSDGFMREEIRLIEDLNKINMSKIPLSLSFKELNIQEKIFLYLHSLIQNKVTDCVYIFDFPELFLSAQEKRFFNGMLIKLGEMGNTLILVDYEGDTGKEIYATENVVSWGIKDGRFVEGKVLLNREASPRSPLACTGVTKDELKNTNEILDHLRQGGLYFLNGNGGANPCLSHILDAFRVLCDDGWLCIGLRVERSSISFHLYSDISRPLIRKLFNGKKGEVSFAEESLIDFFHIREEIYSLLSSSVRGRVLGLSAEAYSKGGEFSCRVCEGRGCFRDAYPLAYSVLLRCSRCKGTGVDAVTSEHRYMDKSPHELLSLSANQARSIFDLEDPLFSIFNYMNNDIVKNLPLNIRICELSHTERVVIGLIYLRKLIFPSVNAPRDTASGRHAILLELPFISMNMKELDNTLSLIKDLGLMSRLGAQNFYLSQAQMSKVGSDERYKDIKTSQYVLIS